MFFNCRPGRSRIWGLRSGRKIETAMGLDQILADTKAHDTGLIQQVHRADMILRGGLLHVFQRIILPSLKSQSTPGQHAPCKTGKL